MLLRLKRGDQRGRKKKVGHSEFIGERGPCGPDKPVDHPRLIFIVATTMPSFIAANERTDGYTHVLLLSTGSVASVKVPLIVKELAQVRVLLDLTYSTLIQVGIYQYEKIKVQVVATKASLEFFHVEDVDAKVWTDEDEWTVGVIGFSMPT